MDKNFRHGGDESKYSYENGELINKYNGGIYIGSCVPIVAGDIFKFTLKRITNYMYF